MLQFFFEPFDFLSQTHYFKEKKHIAIPEELAYFLRDGLFTDFVSDLVRYFLRKDFFRIHLNQNQINLRDDNRYENEIIIQNLCQPDNDAGTSRHGFIMPFQVPLYKCLQRLQGKLIYYLTRYSGSARNER